MNTYKISIIIATYNTADYLEECLDSIFGQTLKDIEVILVDDGSTDNTAAIIKNYKQKHNNLFSFYQENQGAGKARNFAIPFSQGEYMIFMDPDDKYPFEECLERLYVAAKEHNVLICGGDILSNDNGIIKKWYSAGTGDRHQSKNKVIDIKDYFFLYGHTRYLFNTDLIRKNQVEYANYSNYEDQIFTIKALGLAGKFYELDYPVYEYRINYKQREMNFDTLYNTLSGFRDTLRLIIRYNMRLMFEKNCWSFFQSKMSLIVRYIFCGNILFDELIEEINGLVSESGWNCKETPIITQKQIMEYSNAMEVEKKRLEKILSKGNPIIIYGAGNNATKLITGYREQMQNVIGIMVSKLEENHLNCNGISVRSIEYYTFCKDEAIVLITPSNKMKNEITHLLQTWGFKNYEWIDVRLIS